MFEAIEATNVPIKFWGKVVDQDGQALGGVRIEYDYLIVHGDISGSSWGYLEARTGEALSDGDGVFSIQRLKGKSLEFSAFKRSGYQFRIKGDWGFDYYGSRPSGKFVPDQRKPVVFTMVRRDWLEPLIHMEGHLRVSANGSPEGWSLWDGEPDYRGELVIVFKAEPTVPANPAQRLNWSADLAIVGGGIIECPWDEEIRRAPESGYVPTIAYPQEAQKQGTPGRAFYVKTADGKYGRLEIDISPSDDGHTGHCSITSDMNPRPGSRNLEPDD
jgi:hypothetical protein